MNHFRFKADVGRTLVAFANARLETEEAVLAQIVCGGTPEVLAKKVIALVPLAFGRVLLKHLGVIGLVDSIVLVCEGEVDARRFLSSDGVFLRATEIALAMHHNGPRELFRCAVVRDAAVDAVNQFLGAGHTVAELAETKWQEPRLVGLSAAEWDAW